METFITMAKHRPELEKFHLYFHEFYIREFAYVQCVYIVGLKGCELNKKTDTRRSFNYNARLDSLFHRVMQIRKND